MCVCACVCVCVIHTYIHTLESVLSAHAFSATLARSGASRAPAACWCSCCCRLLALLTCTVFRCRVCGARWSSWPLPSRGSAGTRKTAQTKTNSQCVATRMSSSWASPGFTDLAITLVGPCWLEFQASGYSVSSSTFTVVRGRAAAVAWIEQPTTTSSRAVFVPPAGGWGRGPGSRGHNGFR